MKGVIQNTKRVSNFIIYTALMAITFYSFKVKIKVFL